jgi:hypothetical protein
MFFFHQAVAAQTRGGSLAHQTADALSPDHALALLAVLTQADARAAAAAAKAAAGSKTAKKCEPVFAGGRAKLQPWLSLARKWCAGLSGGSRKRSCRADEDGMYDYGIDGDDGGGHGGGHGGGNGGGSGGEGGGDGGEGFKSSGRSRGGERGEGEYRSGERQERLQPVDREEELPPPSKAMLQDWKFHVHVIRRTKTSQSRVLKDELEAAIELAIDEPLVRSIARRIRRCARFVFPVLFFFKVLVSSPLPRSHRSALPVLRHLSLRMVRRSAPP